MGMQMLAEILPPPVAVAEAFGDVLDIALFPEEEAVLASAMAKRRREFTTARACARTALGQLGLPTVPIVPGQRGAPQWPPGVVGSITHCAGYVASAVAHSRDLLTLGLDAEPDDALPAGVLDAIATPDERTALSRLGPGAATPGQPHWDRLLFSAKESVYKAWFPLTRRWLGFDEAVITMNPADGTFAAQLLVPGYLPDGTPLTGFAGRWLARAGLLLTTIALSRAQAQPGTAPTD
jgi:4'-phosphopantetheinyl transferase EntD